MNTLKIRRAKYNKTYSNLQPYQLKLLRRYTGERSSFYQEFLQNNPETELILDLTNNK